MADTSVRIVGEKALGRWFKGLGPEAAESDEIPGTIKRGLRRWKIYKV